ncbi:MAG: leucine-rich repeat domain-containing protein, partial [Euryarchaeota archaeon]|nr:leucine-rich repeat domain-containing protein [Euryarchaeota archaeon]
TNLEWLILYDNNISDISPLADLTNLEWLYLNDNKISDISPLTELTNLQDLRIKSNNVVDISPLANLTELLWLLLDDNYISDLSPLADLTNLDVLSLHYNAIQDITPLKHLTRIGVTNLQDTGIKYHLDLGGNFIEDLSPLVKNPGIDEGDIVHMGFNSLLSKKSIEEYIPTLEERGVEVKGAPFGEEYVGPRKAIPSESPTGAISTEPASSPASSLPQKDNTPIYLGIIGILAALVLVVSLVRKGKN